MAEAFDTLSRDELLRLAGERGIVVRPGARRSEILSLLQNAESEASAVHGDAGSSGSGDAQMEAARSKFDLRPDGEAPAPHDIPWGYGRTRITAMARDPELVYVYWEATDESIAEARTKLGAGGPDAFCVLRVYDTSLRHFDGTNANSYFDVNVDRSWNSFFIRIDRPSATFHVDIGLKSHEGFFAVMARSGAAEMPAAGMSSDGRVEWMTVEPRQQMPRPLSYRHRYVPRPAPPWVGRPHGEALAGAEAVGSWTSVSGGAVWEVDFERVLASLVGGEAAQQGEWFEQIMGGRVVRWIRWTGGRRRFTWRSGPAGTSLPAGLFGPIEVWFEGRRRVLHAAGVTEGGVRYEFGPWYVVIAGSDPHGERRVYDTWVVRISWSSGGGMERIETPMIYRRILGAYRRRIIIAGGSEMLIREEMGASEELMAGASERLWLSASETLMAGASETFALGASERLAIGASERAWGGASGVVWGGASGFAFAGASEREFAGASDRMLGGASFMGGSSERLISGDGGGITGATCGEGWSGFAVVPAKSGALEGRGADVIVAEVLPKVIESARRGGETVRGAIPTVVSQPAASAGRNRDPGRPAPRPGSRVVPAGGAVAKRRIAAKASPAAAAKGTPAQPARAAASRPAAKTKPKPNPAKRSTPARPAKKAAKRPAPRPAARKTAPARKKPAAKARPARRPVRMRR